jgi:hypothetical protein
MTVQALSSWLSQAFGELYYDFLLDGADQSTATPGQSQQHQQPTRGE